MLKDKDIGYILHKVSMLAKNNFSNKLNAIGITTGQFAVLKDLYYYQKKATDSGLSPACIAARLECDRPTISGVIDRLESQGWVERFDNPDDRRSVLIKVTDKAVGKLEELEKMHSENRNTIVKGFSEEEVNDFRNYLLRVVNNLKEMQ
ncbi:MarR family transcriptional regulator for hemolysin [Sedimentibacter acidaminivorans]|jgi:DNA-binding MarR family transcriptional regulator|uniref:MarR family transcriptional regulator for hemolysin n=1 Tax=Sedimentibacter acidaminivorans TaxID=913099 RepID=A0ABS4GHH8_9FIRM|nr:MarR family transcriptional regulator [Sedimentibacter acidaminivorans]MBP1927160.1 MarR family transcriptional regulator for hemolysin [Sedimentibacter acidaminivorans]